MDLLKYLLVGVGSLILGLIVIVITKNIFSGILIVGLIFGGYILMNVVKGLEKDTPLKTPPTPKSD